MEHPRILRTTAAIILRTTAAITVPVPWKSKVQPHPRVHESHYSVKNVIPMESYLPPMKYIEENFTALSIILVYSKRGSTYVNTEEEDQWQRLSVCIIRV